jgi:hypothetical protein
MKKATRRRARRRPSPRPAAILEDRGEVVGLVDELAARPGTSPVLAGGDLDADWKRGDSSGEETVGGSVATPDQDVVDEIGQALGVEQASDAPVVTSEEILRARDRHYWHLERDAAEEER